MIETVVSKQVNGKSTTEEGRRRVRGDENVGFSLDFSMTSEMIFWTQLQTWYLWFFFFFLGTNLQNGPCGSLFFTGSPTLFF